MVNLNKRKGAVELSLNLIIMLVIGLTVLGLIIAFVTSFLGSAEESLGGSLTEDDKTKVDQVLREEGNFAFLSATLDVEKGQTGKLYVKVRNPTAASVPVFAGGPLTSAPDAKFKVLIKSATGSDQAVGSGDTAINIQAPPMTLNQGEEQGYPLLVTPGKSVPSGTYFATFTLEVVVGEPINKVVTFNIN
jgi:hypothetical protein